MYKRLFAFSSALLISLCTIRAFEFSIAQESFLMDAATNGEITKMKAFMLLGADPNALVEVRGCERTDYVLILGEAASFGQHDAIEYLLMNGAHLNATDKYGHNALWYAVNSNEVDTVKLLLSKGARVNGDGETYSALEKAESNRYTEIVELLKQAGASK